MKYSENMRIGKLLIQKELSDRHKAGRQFYRQFQCLCDCGNICTFNTHQFSQHKVASCGCHVKFLLRNNSRKDVGHSSYNYLWNRLKANAKIRNYSVDINFTDFKFITSQNCYFCGEKPRLFNYYFNKDKSPRRGQESISEETKNISWIKVNGIDRIDNMLGYSINNCVPCCSQCNQAKMDNSLTDFKSWLNRIYVHSREMQW